MYRNSNPRIIAIIATAILFLMFLLAGCKSKQQVITEYQYSDSLEVKEVAAVQSTAKATSATSSLQSLFENMSLNIDSIIVMMPSQLSNGYHGESLVSGTAVSPVSPHDHPGMAEGLTCGDTCPAQCGAVASLKTDPITKPPDTRISPNDARHINVPNSNNLQGKIVISGISLNKQTATAAADITASSDTMTEVRLDKSEQTSVNTQSIQRVEGKPRSKNVWQYVIVIAGLALAVGYLMKKFNFLKFITRAIKKLFS